MILFYLIGILTAVRFSSGIIEADLSGDANIYASVIHSLQELELRRQAEKLHQGPSVQSASSVCYDDLGCFDKNGTFGHLKQLPEPPETVNTQFLLYTRKNRIEPQIIDYKKPETVLQSNLDRSLPVKFITHGFGGKNNLTWIWAMKNAFLEKENLNVIAVDWSLGARVPYYIQAAVNSELVGAQIAALFFFLKDNYGIQEKNLHVVGFSLGAHVAGFVGKRMQEMRGTRPARITGLDPASPLFEDYGGEVHLYKEDADFVDVVHTNADMLLYGGVGMEIAIGHADYYPNGGKRQPGCGSTIKGAFMDIFNNQRGRACNHERAVHLYTDSILRPTSCEFVSYPCTNYSDFSLARCIDCGANCGRMGYENKGSGVYFLSTKAKIPYCAQLAKLTVRYAKGVKKSFGELTLTLVGSDNVKENITLTEKDEKLSPGGGKEMAIALGEGMIHIRDINALYVKYTGWFTKGRPDFSLGSVTIEDTRGKILFHTCGGDIHLQDGQYQTLDHSC